MDYSILLICLLGCPVVAAAAMALLPAKATPRGLFEAIHVLSLSLIHI